MLCLNTCVPLCSNFVLPISRGDFGENSLSFLLKPVYLQYRCETETKLKTKSPVHNFLFLQTWHIIFKLNWHALFFRIKYFLGGDAN